MSDILFVGKPTENSRYELTVYGYIKPDTVIMAYFTNVVSLCRAVWDLSPSASFVVRDMRNGDSSPVTESGASPS